MAVGSASESSYAGWITGTVLILVVLVIATAFWVRAHGFP